MNEWLLIVGMSIVTFIPRYLPFALAGRLAIPTWLSNALHFVPTAVLTCIIIKAAFVQDNTIQLTWENHYLIAAIAAFITSWLSRHLLLTVVVGLCCFALLKWL